MEVFAQGERQSAEARRVIKVTEEGIISELTENRRDKRKLISEREMLEIVTQCTGVGLTVISRDYRLLWVNQSLKQTTGAVEGELCHKVYHKKASPCDECGAMEVFRTGRHLVVHEKLVEDINGNHRWIEVISAPFKDKEGNVVAVLEIIVPIDKRKLTEEASRESEEKYRTLFEQSRDAIYITSGKGELIDCNQSLLDLLGYGKEEMMHLDLFKIYANPEDRLRLRKELDEKGSIKDYYVILRKTSGQEIDCLFTSLAKHAGDGNILWHQGIIRDVTEQKRSGDSIRKAEQRYRKLFEEAPIMYLINDHRSGVPIIQDCNNLFLNNLGYSRAEVLGRPLTDFFTPQSREKFLKDKLYQKVLDGSYTPVERELLARDGHIIETLAHVVAETDPDGLVYGVRAMYVDITEQKRAERELRLAVDKLQKAAEGSIQSISSTLEMRDPYTAGHSRRVSLLSCAISREIGLSKDQIEGIRLAGMVHDIGKICVPAEILCKPGFLTPAEFAIMKEHCQIGYDILKAIEFPWPIARIVLQHHEKTDGSGYPSGLSGENILIEARILCVADIVEAMASHRPYRPALGIDNALEEISRNKGALYDSKVVDTCLKLFQEKGFNFQENS